MARAQIRVNTFVAGRQSSPALAPLPGGGFVVVWESLNQDGSSNGTYGIDINDIRPLLNSNIQIVLTDLNNNSVQLDLIAVAANLSMPIVMRH